MKQFIVLAAILPIMLVFVAQFSIEAVRSLRMNAAEDAIRAFCIEASYYGGGNESGADALRNRLAQIFQADAGEVYVSLVQTDDAHIDWRISFPVGEIMAGGAFMGLSPSENQGYAELNGTIVIAPPPPEPQPEPELPKLPELPEQPLQTAPTHDEMLEFPQKAETHIWVN
jgi:hypothetical protein